MKKVVLLGDTTRQGYDKYVKLALEDVAQVYYPSVNSKFSAFLLRRLPDWIEQLGCGDDIDLIHWNVGQWDCLHMLDGRPHTDIKLYRDHLYRIYTELNMLYPGAKQIFATTGAVVEAGYTGRFKCYNHEIEAYNAAARQVLGPLGVQINDLYALTKEFPVEYYSDGMARLDTRQATQPITEQVVACIEESLGVKGRSLDYDMLFEKPEEVVGI